MAQTQILQQQITTLRADLETHEANAASTKAQLEEAQSLREQLADSQVALALAQEEVSRMETQLGDQEKVAQELEAARSELSQRTHDDTEYNALATRASIASSESEEARIALQEVHEIMAELQASSEALRIRRDEAVEAAETAAGVVQELRDSLTVKRAQHEDLEVYVTLD